MSQETDMVLRGNKNAMIIENISEMFGMSVQEATDIFYNSETSELIEEGIADLHCRSEKYLATLVWEEYKESSLHSYPSPKARYSSEETPRHTL